MPHRTDCRSLTDDQLQDLALTVQIEQARRFGCLPAGDEIAPTDARRCRDTAAAVRDAVRQTMDRVAYRTGALHFAGHVAGQLASALDEAAADYERRSREAA